MKRDYIDNNIKDIILESIEKAAIEYGITYDIVSIKIYGSTLSNKENPNDIDIYVHLQNLDSEFVDFEADETDEYNSPEEQKEIYLAELMHEALHHQLLPEKMNGKPLDIAIKTYEYDYELQEAIDIDKYINNILNPSEHKPKYKKYKK